MTTGGHTVAKRLQPFSALVFGAVSMAAQTLLLRRFLWRFESLETGVALFFACWLFWSGMGAAFACTRPGRRVVGGASRAPWLLIAVCAALYFFEYALIGRMREWLGVPDYQAFPLARLALGCLLANAPFGLAAGLVIPSVCARMRRLGMDVGRAFAWEALGAAAGGLAVTAALAVGCAPDPRDESEWRRLFPDSAARPGRFETVCGTTFYGTHGGTFYALTSGGVAEVLPERERAMEPAVLALSQRPYAQDVLLLGRVPLAVGLALEKLRPQLSIVWCPTDAEYGCRVVKAVRTAGFATRVRAAGLTPQRCLDEGGEARFDVVLAVPPPATTLEGCAWRQTAFARRVRCAVRRTGVALFGLGCDSAAPSPEDVALTESHVCAVRQAWPESGVFAAGAGGWWIAAQVPKLAYDPVAATARFGMLKNVAFPVDGVPLLYDAPRAQGMAERCPALDPARPVLVPVGERREDVLALGFADAIRKGCPTVPAGEGIARFKTEDGFRAVGFLLVALCVLPAACSRRERALRRLAGGWVAASGGLGLAASLAVLYGVQARFGALYLFAGAGSCLYLAGAFCGNRAGAWLAGILRAGPDRSAGLPFGFAAAQAAVSCAAAVWSEAAPTIFGSLLLCFAAGNAAGATIPAALALTARDETDPAAAFVLFDALGAALGGLAFACLVPLGGVLDTVVLASALTVGMGACLASGRRHARFTAALALAVALAVAGGRLRGMAVLARDVAPAPSENRTDAGNALGAGAAGSTNWVGIPRRLDMEQIRERMAKGLLATNEAAFWEKFRN